MSGKEWRRAQSRLYAPAEAKVTDCEWDNGQIRDSLSRQGGGVGPDPGAYSSSGSKAGAGAHPGEIKQSLQNLFAQRL
jgi:hypothetical protein